MTHRLSRLLPLAAVAAILAGTAMALATVSGASASDDPAVFAEDGAARDVAATCAAGARQCIDTVDVGAPDIAPMCIEGPAADCVDTIAPDDAIADCQADPCYDTLPVPSDQPLDGCKKIADDLIACIADPNAPVSGDGPHERPAEPPDGTVSEPYPGEGSPSDAGQLAEDIAAREECIASGCY